MIILKYVDVIKLTVMKRLTKLNLKMTIGHLLLLQRKYSQIFHPKILTALHFSTGLRGEDRV